MQFDEHKNKTEYHNHEDLSQVHENKTFIVVVFTALTMIIEIVFGYWTKSIALLADGYHMATHVLALGLSWSAYVIVRKYSNNKKYSFGKDKLLSLSGFSSAIFLLFVAVLMAFHAINRLLSPEIIKFSEAIFVAVIGLIVNIVSAIILHHKHEHSDHNIRSAYFHVLADGLTSLTAIVALIAGMFYNLYSLDAISGIISSVVITKWAVELIITSGSVLIDFKRNK